MYFFFCCLLPCMCSAVYFLYGFDSKITLSAHLILHTPAGGKVKLHWDRKRWQLKGKSARFYFQEGESDNKDACRLCTQKLTYNERFDQSDEEP